MPKMLSMRTTLTIDDDLMPLIEDLRRKDHIAVVRLTKKDVTRPDLPAFLEQQFKLARPYMGMLTKAVGLPF